MENKQIVPYQYPASLLSYKIPDSNGTQYQRTLTAIKNAWRNSASLDRSGYMWVTTDSLHVILRTIPGNAKYMAASISEEHKITCDGRTYIRGFELMKLICKAIEECGSETKAEYLQFSEMIYVAIRDSEKAKYLRMVTEFQLKDARKRLKRNRMRIYKITTDELTGHKLIYRESDFSHIRSFSLFPQLGDNLYNGLVVNKSTHKIITAEHVTNEDDLFELCIKKGWKTNWYDLFKRRFA